MDDIAIQVENVSKNFKLPHEKVGSIKGIFTHLFSYLSHKRSYETQHALKNVTLQIKKGEFFGIVGRNGSGKSTLLKMLAGIYQPTNGVIRVNGRLVPFIELGVGFSPELTGKQNVYLNGALLGFSQKEVDDQYDDIVNFAELRPFMDQKLKNYSSGMQVRLAFSMAVRAKAEILLIDEVLAVGDADFQRKCFDYFKKLKKEHITVIFVSHNMEAVREYCDRAMLIENSEVVEIGHTESVAQKYLQLFNANNDPATSVGVDKKHWGTGDARINTAKIELKNNNILIKVTANIKNHIDKLIYGLHIIGADGAEITAMNNRMINAPDIKNIEPGQIVNFEWKMQNVFSDGLYSITLTLVDDSAKTLDWASDVAHFRVKRAQHSTTAILPPVEVICKVERS